MILQVKIVADNIGKSFNGHCIFKDLSFVVEYQEGLIISGANGSGKSTLIKILCGLLSPTKGRIEYHIDNEKVIKEQRRSFIGLVSPEIQLYDELTALENIQFFSKLMGLYYTTSGAKNLLQEFGLRGRGYDRLHSFSSGMKQRFKYIIGLLKEPPILFLDEPLSNLDKQGQLIVDKVCHRQLEQGILVIATNDDRDLKYGEKHIRLHGGSSRGDT
ncbi:MAG: ATP-binding cassette domain-containing protein [candidate division Zixibacteria bacterium]|nr:ATP-binding cassette domain-containing protein [candidate division Zixibacteria bacterium]